MKIIYDLNMRDQVDIEFSGVMIEYVGAVLQIVSKHSFDGVTDDDFVNLKDRIKNLDEWEKVELKLIRMPLYDDWTEEDFSRIQKRFMGAFEL